MKKQGELFGQNKTKTTQEHKSLMEYLEQGGKTTPKQKNEYDLPLFQRETPKQGELF